MRNHHRIWESANRPLLVKSVWNHSCGGYRHFILDFQPEHKLNYLNYKPEKRVTYKIPPIHDEYGQNNDDDDDILQLVGSIKLQQRPTPFLKIPKPASNVRKVVNKSPRTFLDFLRRRGAVVKEEPPSKRSSLVDLNAAGLDNTSRSDEKLAERVLNWLDLAGKTPLLQTNTTAISNSPVLKKSTLSKNRKSHQQGHLRSTTTTTTTTVPVTVKRSESVKHITIIFNKEGIPVRYNRPIRYTDFFRFGFNVPQRKFGNPLAASRRRLMQESIGDTMVQSVLPGNAAFEKAAMDLNRSKGFGRMSNVRKNFENDYRSLISKRILEESCNLREMKKQLHIFMPSLPKKTANLLVPTDCASSMISGASGVGGG